MQPLNSDPRTVQSVMIITEPGIDRLVPFLFMAFICSKKKLLNLNGCMSHNGFATLFHAKSNTRMGCWNRGWLGFFNCLSEKCDRLCINQPCTAKHLDPVFFISSSYRTLADNDDVFLPYDLLFSSYTTVNVTQLKMLILRNVSIPIPYTYSVY